MSDAPLTVAQQSTLDNGLRVISQHMPGVRSAAVGMWVAVGSRDETPEQSGCSHFLEHLLFKGTANRDALEIASALDEVGGEMNAFTSNEVTCFYARVLDRDVPLAFEILGDMLATATNTAADVDGERQVVLEEINIHFDSPDDIAHTRFAQVVLGDHGLGLETLGSRESIEGMARDTIHDYYQHYYRPELVTVSVAGSVTHDQAIALAQKFVGDLGRPDGARPQRSAPTPGIAGNITTFHRPTDQAHVVVGGRQMSMVDDRRHAARVANAILGSGMSSRLFQEIREKRGLAYTTYSYNAMHPDAGWYGAYAGTNPANAQEVAGLLHSELDRITEDLLDDEVRKAKSQLAGSIVLSLENPSSVMMRNGRLESLDLPVEPIDTVLADLDAVTPNGVRAVAAEIYGAPRAVSVVGPFEDDVATRFAPTA